MIIIEPNYKHCLTFLKCVTVTLGKRRFGTLDIPLDKCHKLEFAVTLEEVIIVEYKCVWA